MGSEKSLWSAFRTNAQKHFGNKIHLQRHEDECSQGIPDISYTMIVKNKSTGLYLDARSGWVELKYTSEYPKRDSTPIRLEHFTLEQKDWLRSRGALGCQCCVLWQINKDYYVFSWRHVYSLGSMT